MSITTTKDTTRDDDGYVQGIAERGVGDPETRADLTHDLLDADLALSAASDRYVNALGCKLEGREGFDLDTAGRQLKEALAGYQAAVNAATQFLGR